MQIKNMRMIKNLKGIAINDVLANTVGVPSPNWIAVDNWYEPMKKPGMMSERGLLQSFSGFSSQESVADGVAESSLCDWERIF